MTAYDEQPACSLKQGTAPLLISIPHLATYIPDPIAATMTETALACDDTDWHLDRLYAFAADLGASVLTPAYSRYVIDLNRPPDGASLYPGRSTTSLCPVDTFNEEALYQSGKEPDDAEQARRLQAIWQPYHHALRSELNRLHAEHGYVLLWDAHSIRSRISRFFDGVLPDFNIGTADDSSAAAGLAQTLSQRVTAHSRYTAVANGRFKGGYITRHYGDPARGIHAIQLELAQTTYMQETRPYDYDEDAASAVAPIIEGLIGCALEHIRQTPVNR